jgi:hypothetical protein
MTKFIHQFSRLPRILLLSLAFGSSLSIASAQNEQSLIHADLYFLLMRYDTSSVIDSPNSIKKTRTDRDVSWFSSNQIQTTSLVSGRLNGPFHYSGYPNFYLGQERLDNEGKLNIAPEASCVLQPGKQLVFLFPSDDESLTIHKSIAVPLPQLPIGSRNVLVINLSPQELAVLIRGSKQPLIVQPLEPAQIPTNLIKDTLTLRLDLATNSATGWSRIPGTRVMLGKENTQVVLVHPSFNTQKKWTVRTQSLIN